MTVWASIKGVHIACVVLSAAGFLLRGFWMLRASPLLTSRPARILPHLVDTLLLASALTLAVMSGQYPFVQSWLTAKVLGLVAYIVLGSIALKRGRSRTVRVAALAAAVLCFAYIVSVALTRNPWGGLALAG
jgi:uncharacterized membrane protein SirB2